MPSSYLEASATTVAPVSTSAVKPITDVLAGAAARAVCIPRKLYRIRIRTFGPLD